MLKLANNWFKRLSGEFEKPYFLDLQKFLTDEYNTKTIYPKSELVFNALNQTKYEDVKVVIFGQDPYHQPNQAHGLSFSVCSDVPIPPSLKNIFKEIENSLSIKTLQDGNLIRWAKQGVLLLNTVLTVEQNKPNSHKNKGWEQFTSSVVKILSERESPIIFLLWGANARIFEPLIAKHHYILKSAHPSPLSAYNGFFGCGHFAKTNQILRDLSLPEINWE